MQKGAMYGSVLLSGNGLVVGVDVISSARWNVKRHTRGEGLVPGSRHSVVKRAKRIIGRDLIPPRRRRAPPTTPLLQQ
ncbi:hypothetical protein CALCODRAFT_500446 [Calocera cornea HHB12733]|uniref:Uncharacterized protein n=1 Tax=Calocera cornea HHB12733 TaxID=1353952 RepID=A0A165E317_9BASI|nr:hypothetical protein CALCODRAFT_500446 [Calocera cornea HHB12733]